MSFGAYICDSRELKAGLFKDTNNNGVIDRGEKVSETGGYSGRGIYSFDGDNRGDASVAPINEPVEYHKVYHAADDYNWTVEEFATGYRNGMEIHAGRNDDIKYPTLGDRLTRGCIRVREETLDALDKLHGITAKTTPQKVATALIVVKDVQFISGHSLTNAAGNVALIDPSLYAADGKAGYVQTLIAGAGNDFLYGGNQRNVLYGGAGNDHLFGRGGNDSMVGGAGADRLNGGTGDDSIVAGSSKTDQSDKTSNLIDGGWGSDNLYGSGGNDKLIGQQGADVLRGGDGNDILMGDFSFSGYLSDSSAPKGPSDIFSRLLQEDGAWKPVAFNTGPLFLEETGGKDLLIGGSGDDLLFGGFSDDRLLGEDGNDWLVGGSGNDNLNGGLGNDLIFGGGGIDILVGSDGSDTFYFRTGDVVSGEQINGGNGIDAIELVQPGKVDLSASTIFGVTATVSSIEALLGSAGNDTLIGASNASTTINGRAGADTMKGGWMSDIYIVDNIGDVVTDKTAMTEDEEDILFENPDTVRLIGVNLADAEGNIKEIEYYEWMSKPTEKVCSVSSYGLDTIYFRPVNDIIQLRVNNIDQVEVKFSSDAETLKITSVEEREPILISGNYMTDQIDLRSINPTNVKFSSDMVEVYLDSDSFSDLVFTFSGAYNASMFLV